jgi:hypothetical protein
MKKVIHLALALALLSGVGAAETITKGGTYSKTFREPVFVDTREPVRFSDCIFLATITTSEKKADISVEHCLVENRDKLPGPFFNSAFASIKFDFDTFMGWQRNQVIDIGSMSDARIVWTNVSFQ